MRLKIYGAIPVSGVVRFRRDDKHGFDGQFLEMQKRCSDFTCGTACTANCAGFVSFGGQDWTTSTTAANTKFTIFLVMKTYQQSGDVNPMGIINLATGNAKTGLGLYTIPSMCTPALSSSITVAPSLSTKPHIYLKTDGKATLRSTVPGAYNGMWVHFHEAEDAQMKYTRTGLACKIKQYLVVGYLKTSLNSASTTTATLVGGAGSVGGVACSFMAAGGLGQLPSVRFGRVDVPGSSPSSLNIAAAADKTLSAQCAANNGDTVITWSGNADFSTNNVQAGTAVYFATGATVTEFYTTVVDADSCTGKNLNDDTNTGGNPNLLYTSTIADNTVVSIIPGDGVNCKADDGNGKAPFGRLSTISAYYGAAEASAYDSNGDNSCQTECETFGCDPTSGNYGHPTKVLEGELAVALTTTGVN
jgi:hypothetical protein